MNFLLGALLAYIFLRKKGWEPHPRIRELEKKLGIGVPTSSPMGKVEEVIKPVDPRTVGLKVPGFTLPALEIKEAP